MSKHIKWSLARLVNAICNRLQNKFDVFMTIEGKRGLGKSTLGFKILLLVKREMKRRGVDGYKFSPRRDTIYTRKEVLKFFHKWRHSGLADEMVNVTFNRDFYNEDQKDIIKMINMNRDHNNLFIACVPQFKVLDSQIKNLCSIKITVLRRGVAIVHFPNKTVYSSDIWDERINEKIEREWLKGGVSQPKYRRLTTFRGYLNFPKLTDNQEALYQSIKDEKRNIIAQEKQMADQQQEEENDPVNIIFNKLVNKEVKNGEILKGMILGHGLNHETIKKKLQKKLEENHKPTAFKNYFFDPKKKDTEEQMDDKFYKL